jgi:signal transduction histidine kinase
VLQPVRRMAQAAETLSRCIDEASAASKETLLFFEPIVFRDFFKTFTVPAGLEVKNNCDADLMILGDRRKLKETFEQILRNAVEAKATSEIITSTKDSPTVRLCFRDNGHGIKAEVMPKIFDPFFTTRAQQRLFGLGLFRARGELARMKAEIFAASDGKTYTEILVRIPVP